MNDTELSSLSPESCFEFRPTFSSVLRYVPQWVISSLGFLGNLTVAIFFAQKQPKRIGELPIILLAFVDCLMCIFSIIFTSFIAIWQPNIRDIGCHRSLCIIGNVAFDVPYTYSCGMMCFMSLSRYFAACKPHDYAGFFNFKRQRIYYITLLLVAIPACGLQVRSCNTAPNNWLVKLFWVIQRTILVLVTIVCMVYCYWNIVNTLQAAKVKRQEISRREHNVQYIRSRRETIKKQRARPNGFKSRQEPAVPSKDLTETISDSTSKERAKNKDCPTQEGSAVETGHLFQSCDSQAPLIISAETEDRPNSMDYATCFEEEDEIDIDGAVNIFIDEDDDVTCDSLDVHESSIVGLPVTAIQSAEEQSLCKNYGTVMTDQSNQQSLPNRIHVSGQALVSKDPQLSLVMRPITDQNGLETRQDETTLLKHRAPRFSLSLFSTRIRGLDHEGKMAACFFLIGSAFLILTIPDLILHLLDSMLDETNQKWVSNFVWMQTVTQTLFCINFSVNPLIYYHVNGFFRTKVRYLLSMNSINSIEIAS
ncbi:uncharacterized protein LOC142335075 isoform X2 [Convolutriloba macropyga]|uniref:uncharacterized protein LOC142335075 isoform X2 n=1 Tax=Convolutriloba macropyga TaxID=536237 RepID=UPI003F520358